MELRALNRRERLILTAIEILDELGVQGLSIREVAKRQQMSNATMFSHFKSKTELMLAVLDHFSQYDSAVIQSIKAKGLTGKDAIRSFVDAFATYYENYPAITSIIQSYDTLRCEPELEEKIRTILSSRSNYVKRMVEEAQTQGQIRSDFDSDCFTDVMMGACRAICLKWRVNRYNFSLSEQVRYALDMMMDSFTPNGTVSSK